MLSLLYLPPSVRPSAAFAADRLGKKVNRSDGEPESKKQTGGEGVSISELSVYSEPALCVPVGFSDEHCSLSQFLVAEQCGLGH